MEIWYLESFTKKSTSLVFLDMHVWLMIIILHFKSMYSDQAISMRWSSLFKYYVH